MRTPGPWEIKYEYNIFGPHERGIAACGGYHSNINGERVHEENKDNAAFIVKACNCYDELVAALKDTLLLYDSDDWYNDKVANRARYALKKAGEI